MVEGERRAGAVTQQPFPPRPAGAFDAHRGIERAAAAVGPATHLVTSILLEQAAADEGAQHPRCRTWVCTVATAAAANP